MTPTTDHPTRHGPRPLGALAIGILAAVVLAACAGEVEDDLAQRQADVAQRGAEVMPFDLDATTHRFQPIETGLVQTVISSDPADDEQVALIREHLEDEAARFARGDFDDPATIHGEDMPGLAELRAGATDIDIQLEHLEDGSRLTYTTSAPTLVEALHRWGEAQVSDHGDHAEHGS